MVSHASECLAAAYTGQAARETHAAVTAVGSTERPAATALQTGASTQWSATPSDVRGLGSDYLHPLMSGIRSQTQYNLQI